MEAKKVLELQASEQTLVAAASRIYAAYVVSGQVREGQEEGWLARSLREAVWFGEHVDDSVIAEGEMS